jgi:hypothetical protein
MTNISDDQDDDKPLDPAMEKVRRKLARLMVVSIGIMLVGLMAVLGAVVYKSGAGSGSTEVARAAIELPAGFTVTSTAVSERRILFYGEGASGNGRVLVFDSATGALVADHAIR